MALLFKRILLVSLVLLLNACVYYPRAYGGGYGRAHYYDAKRDYHHGHHHDNRRYRGNNHHYGRHY